MSQDSKGAVINVQYVQPAGYRIPEAGGEKIRFEREVRPYRIELVVAADSWAMRQYGAIAS